ncbi:uncharacterized protein PG998_012864 [Apiospora kogelbergensis]|uniref:uncharacterized protein n=1 Tax=Apiospora kogelbergensis TaxID=1337665 RepID=UPI0031306AF9
MFAPTEPIAPQYSKFGDIHLHSRGVPFELGMAQVAHATIPGCADVGCPPAQYSNVAHNCTIGQRHAKNFLQERRP